MFFKIMLEYYLQLSKLRTFCFHEVLVVPCCAIHNWSGASRRDTDWSLPGDYLGSSCTWRSVSMVLFSLSLILEDLFSHLPCSTKLTVNGVQICGDYYTWGILPLGFYMRRLHVPISSNSCIGVYIYPSDSGNIVSYIETSVNKTFCLTSTLNILDVWPDYSYIWLWEDLDNTRFWGQNNIIKDVILFDNVFNHIWSNRNGHVFLKIWNAYDFEIGLWLREI